MSDGKRPAAVKRRTLRRPLSPQEQRQRQERRGAGRRLVIMGVFVLVTLFLTLAMIQMVIRSTAPEPKLYIVREGSIVSEIFANALLVRNEVLLDSPAAGMFMPAANDGDKVRKDQVLGRVISAQGEDLWEDLSEIDYKISTRQLELMATGQLGRAEIVYESTDDKLLPLVNQIRRGDRVFNLAETDLLAERMQVIVDERNKRLMAVDGGDETLSALFAEKNKAEEKLSALATNLISPVSGLVCYGPDSLTARLNGDSLISKTPEEIKNLMKTLLHPEINSAREVKKAEDIAFVVQDVYQYIAFLLPERQAAEFPLDRRYDIVFPNEGIKVEQAGLELAQADKDNLFLVFKTDKELGPLINQRILHAKILLESDRGLKVPKEALLFPDEHNSSLAHVMLVRSGYVYDEAVEVLKMDEDYAIISSPIGAQHELAMGSIIVQNPAAVTAGEQLGG